MGRRVLDLSEADPKGLVRESYNIDGITLGECRSIFMDWALSVPIAIDTAEALRTLLAQYMTGNESHPMTSVLTEALNTPSATPARRGGRMGRLGA